MEQYPTVAGDDSVTHPVNIIGIMDESFADFTIFDSFESSEDPTPFLHSLKKNTIKGWMYSPVTGGGTASVEFEYLYVDKEISVDKILNKTKTEKSREV